MFKKFLVFVFVFFLAFSASAQQGTASPYSFYGIGEIKFKGAAENRFMGGVSVFTDSIHINLQNPASYASLELTSFTMGGTFTSSKFSTELSSQKAQRNTLDYLAVGLPLGKFGAAFGLMPYSTVGYKVRTENVEEPGLIRKYSGNGGMNKAFIGVAYQINTNLSVGADINYNFGRIESTNIKNYTYLQLGTEEYNDSELSGFNINLGAMYKRKLNAKLDLYGSVAFTPEGKLKTKNSRLIGTIIYAENFSPNVDFLPETNSEVSIVMPNKFSIGAGIGQNRKWLVGTEVTYKQSEKMRNRFTEPSNSDFENAVKFSVGGYYIPNYGSFSNYFHKIVYRAGFRYENTGLIVNNHSILDRAVTAGFGFPVGGTFSNINLGAEFGKTGTTRTQLVEENYINVVLSLSLNDKWFVKRKYD